MKKVQGKEFMSTAGRRHDQKDLLTTSIYSLAIGQRSFFHGCEDYGKKA
jgi:hypothetical protein